jgi:hypothetical protein
MDEVHLSGPRSWGWLQTELNNQGATPYFFDRIAEPSGPRAAYYTDQAASSNFAA